MHNLHKENSSASTVVVFGCGNTLLGDDGFGPTVIDRLRSRDLRQQARARHEQGDQGDD